MEMTRHFGLSDLAAILNVFVCVWQKNVAYPKNVMGSFNECCLLLSVKSLLDVFMQHFAFVFSLFRCLLLPLQHLPHFSLFVLCCVPLLEYFSAVVYVRCC